MINTAEGVGNKPDPEKLNTASLPPHQLIKTTYPKKKRYPQKGASCRIDNCNNPCIGNGLCAKCTMALRRYGNVNGKPKRKITCVCGVVFESNRSDAKFHTRRCYWLSPQGKKNQVIATRKWRKNKKKEELA